MKLHGGMSVGFLLVMCTLTGTPLVGQASASVSTPVEAVAYRPRTVDQALPVRTITISMHDVVPMDALRAIAAAAGLRVIVSDDLLPRRLVSVQVVDGTVMDAVRQVLRGAPLVAHITDTGLLIVTTEANIQAAAARGIIVGTVIDAATRRPLSGATVTLDNGAMSRVSADDGTFRFPDVVPGVHTVMIRRLGYSAATRRITLGDGATAKVDVALDVAANTLDQVVVTGTVIATERKAVPNAISVITSQDIEQRGITSIDQIFRGEVPGVFDQSRGQTGTSTNGYGNTYVTARGVNQVGSTGIAQVTPIKTYVDGVEVSYPFYLQSIDPRTIDRIELIPGPQASTIYGSGALGGVLQIFTKRGTVGSPHLLLSLATGEVQSSYNNSLTPRNELMGEFSGGTEGLTYSAGGGYTYTGQWLPGLYQRDVNGYVAATYAATPTLTADVSLRASQRGNGSNTYTFLVPGEASGLYSYNPGDFVPSNVSYSTKTQTAGVGVTWQPRTWWQHQLAVGTDETNQGSFKDAPTYLTASDTLLSVVLIPNRKQTVRYSTTVQGRLASQTTGNLTVGADAMQYESTTSVASTPALTGTLSGGAASPPFISRTTENEHGAFAQAQLAFWDALFLTGGLRGEYDSNYGRSYGLNYAPRYGASVVHTVGPITAKLRAAYGRATRAPASGAREAVFLTNTTYGTYESQVASPNLGPEFQAGTEGGLELYFGSRASLQITHYDQHVDNLIISVPVDSVQSINPNTVGNYIYAPVTQKQNVGAVRNVGWEGQAHVNIISGFSLDGTLSNTISRFQHLLPTYKCGLAATQVDECLYPGASLYNLAEHTGALAANYAAARFNLNVSMSYIGQRHFAYDIGDYYAATDGRLSTSVFTYVPVTAPGYETYNVRGAYQISRSLQATLAVQNAGNSHDGDYTGRLYLPAIGRTTMVGLRISR